MSTQVVVTETPASEVIIEGEASNIVETPVTDNEVIIASIEADKEIAIAEIHADARIAEVEAYAETRTDEGDLEWRINQLSEQVANLTGMLEVLTQPPVLISEPLPLSSEEMTEIAEDLTGELEGQNLIQTSTLEETSSTQMEVIDESEGESLVPPLLEVGRKPIIKLV